LFGKDPANVWLGELAAGVLRERASRPGGEGGLVARRHELPVSVTCAPVFDRAGGARGAVVVLHDLSMQQTLEATTRRVDRLAAPGARGGGPGPEDQKP